MDMLTPPPGVPYTDALMGPAPLTPPDYSREEEQEERMVVGGGGKGGELGKGADRRAQQCCVVS